MRYDAEQKARTRQAVLDAASRELKREGPDAMGVASVMEAAGLTHGGFYAHFKSKRALVVATIEHMFEGARRRWDSLGGLEPYVAWYLSPAHRDARDTGCAIAALSADLPRLPAAARDAFSAGTQSLIDRIATHLGGPDAPVRASSIVAELVGALAMSRIERDPARSDALLAASRRSVLSRTLS